MDSDSSPGFAGPFGQAQFYGAEAGNRPKVTIAGGELTFSATDGAADEG